MAARDPEARVLAAKIATATRSGRSGTAEDRRRATEPARKGMRARFLREADPDGTLTEAEREARADQLQHAHMLRMAAAAARSRRRRRVANLRTQLAEAEAAVAEVDGGVA